MKVTYLKIPTKKKKKMIIEKKRIKLLELNLRMAPDFKGSKKFPSGLYPVAEFLKSIEVRPLTKVLLFS